MLRRTPALVNDSGPSQDVRFGERFMTLVRREIHELDRDERQSLNDAFEELKAATGRHSYRTIAELLANGAPDDPELVLPWHRVYLVVFERAMRHYVPDTQLAYWDWTSATARSEGLPDAFTSVTYDDGVDNSWLNALRRAPLDANVTHTERHPAAPSDLDRIAQAAEEAQALDDHRAFVLRLGEIGSEVAQWVGGHLDGTPQAAFDPLFWFHWSTIDSQWARWQQVHPDAAPLPSWADAVLSPFQVKVTDTLATPRLGYTYG